MNMGKKRGMVLISGSSGLLGQELCNFFKSREIPFTRLIRKGTQDTHQNEIDSNSITVKWPEGLKEVDFTPYTAYIHLALAPIKQRMKYKQVAEENLQPLINIETAISKSNRDCQIIFISSQAAVKNASSHYGRMKFECEQFLKESDASWTIVTPALIVEHKGKGIFGKITRTVCTFPIVPTLGGNQFIQLVWVNDVCEAILNIVNATDTHRHKTYSLALPPIPFNKLIKRIAHQNSKMRLFVTIPVLFVDLGFRILEFIFKNPPISRSSLVGLLELRAMDYKGSWQALEIVPRNMGELLSASGLNSIGMPRLEYEAHSLYKQFFNKSPNQTLVERYVQAHHFIIRPNTKYECDIDYIFNQKLDLEALELVIRGHKTLLTKKCLLLMYLAEMQREHIQDFYSTKNARIKGFSFAIFSILRTAWKFIKGHFILWRHPECMMQ